MARANRQVHLCADGGGDGSVEHGDVVGLINAAAHDEGTERDGDDGPAPVGAGCVFFAPPKQPTDAGDNEAGADEPEQLRVINLAKLGGGNEA